MIKIYEIEKQRGLEKTIKSSVTASYMADSLMAIGTDNNIVTSVKADLPKELLQSNKDNVSIDLLDIYSIMVSTNWNKNDDVFTPDELKKAAHTPLYKPVNYQHKWDETIGVIHSVVSVDKEYNMIDLEEEDPDFFHLLVGMYVWQKYFSDYANKVIKGIENNEMFVSMEALIGDFGYALQDLDSNKIQLLDRIEETAWLSSHLRIYGGSGYIHINEKEYRVGRWLKDFVFSGIGFVKNPANPESIIFEDFTVGNVCDYSIEVEKEYFKNILAKSVFIDRQKGDINDQVRKIYL